jgi:hypothetical protein
MSKKFRLAFKRTLCRCCYTAEELLVLSGRSKSIYCSDRVVGQSMRKNNTKLTYVDLNGSKMNGKIMKPELLREVTYTNGGCRPSRFICYHSQSTGRLNEVFNNYDRGQVERCIGFGPRAAGIKYTSSTNSSLVSIFELDSDSLVEMKVLSTTCSSSNLFNAKVLTVPLQNGISRNASFV